MERKYYKESSKEEVLQSLTSEEMLSYMDYAIGIIKNYEILPDKLDDNIEDMELCIKLLIERTKNESTV